MTKYFESYIYVFKDFESFCTRCTRINDKLLLPVIVNNNNNNNI